MSMENKSNVEFFDPTEESFISIPESSQNICRYIFATNFIKDKVVLDLASGAGHGSYLMATKKAKTVFGVDYSASSIDYSTSQYKTDNLMFIHANATNLPFEDEYFDVIVSFETIEHVKNYKKFIYECLRCLKKNGLFIISTPNKQLSPVIRPKKWNHYHEFVPNEFFSTLNKHFEEVQYLCQSNVNPIAHILKTEFIIITSRILGNKINILSSLIQKHELISQKKLSLTEVSCENVKIKSYQNNFFKVPLYLVALAKRKK